MTKLAKIVLPLVVLALGLLGASYLKATKPVVSPAEPLERVWTVSVATVHYADQRPELALYGEVVAGREVEMRALVAGQVIEVGDGFVDGAKGSEVRRGVTTAGACRGSKRWAGYEEP